jgi:hypothetical protein
VSWEDDRLGGQFHKALQRGMELFRSLSSARGRGFQIGTSHTAQKERIARKQGLAV